MTVMVRSSSADMLVFATVHISATTFPIACVDSVPPVAGRAGMLRSLADGAGARERARLSENEEVEGARQVQREWLTHAARWRKAAGRSDREFIVWSVQKSERLCGPDSGLAGGPKW